MAGCYECTIGVAHNGSAIGVCGRCQSLACAGHGGKPRQQPRFRCCSCITGLLTTSSGGPPGTGPGGGPPGGGTGPGGPSSPGTGGGPGPVGGPGGPDLGFPTAEGTPDVAFQSTLDFELQLPAVASASEAWRRAILPDSVRRAVQQLFRLRQDESERAEFCEVIAGELEEPVRDQVRRQIAYSGEMHRLFEERGGENVLIEAGINEIVVRIRSWLDSELDGWMMSIHDQLDETVWLGEPDSPSGVVDIALIADALGLNAYRWNAEVGSSPFRRLDIAATTATGLLVLSELYAQSMPVIA
jgi:hypothetical protein